MRLVDLNVVCALALSLLAACGRSPEPSGAARELRGEDASDKVLNLYIWSDYLPPNALSDFERDTGIKVNVSYFDTNETLETRLLAGHSGFDVVVPTASYLERQIKAGVYLPLDKSKLPNLRYMDASLMARAALHDADNAHAVIYAWGTLGIGYNTQQVKKALPDTPLEGWNLVFDPAVVSKLAACGVSMLDSPAEVTRLVLEYLKLDPNSRRPEDLAAVERTLVAIRPYIRNFTSSAYIEALANGDTCLAVGFNGDVLQARNRARDANRGVEVRYIVPKPGSIMWSDMLAIPKDAPHVASAYAFVNYTMEPRVSANLSNFMRFASANDSALPFINPEVREDTGVFPTQEVRSQLGVQLADSPEQTRAIVRMWQRFKTGT
jgi:putrescine transport system substrate-binding protein